MRRTPNNEPFTYKEYLEEEPTSCVPDSGQKYGEQGRSCGDHDSIQKRAKNHPSSSHGNAHAVFGSKEEANHVRRTFNNEPFTFEDYLKEEPTSCVPDSGQEYRKQSRRRSEHERPKKKNKKSKKMKPSNSTRQPLLAQ